LRSR
jgi:hypothetical protein